MDSKTKRALIIGGAVVLALVVLGGSLALVLSGGGGRERANMLALAREYIERGDFDRALDLLDRLIIKDVNDADARALRDEALAGKAAKAAQGGQDAAAGSPVDTQALAQSLDQLGRSLERTASSVAAGAASGSGGSSAAATAAQQRAAADQAAAQAEAEAAAKKAEEEARAKAEADAEAARRRAQEEALAKANAELRAQMEAVNALVRQGRDASKTGDYPKAKDNFDKATGMLPSGEPKFASQTWADIAEGYYDGYKLAPESSGGVESIKQAQRAAQEAIRLAPTDPATARPHYTLSKIYNDAKLPDQALASLEQAVKLDPNEFLYAFELGRAYFNVRKFEEARRAFESVTTRLNPRYEPAFYNLGMTFRALNNNASALTAFRRATELKPDYVLAHVQTGIILQSRNDLAGAAAAFNSALSFDANNLTALRRLGEVQVAQGRLADAERSFERALSQASDATTTYNLAKVKYDLGKAPEALALARRAVELAPANALYHYQLGLSAERVGDLDAAVGAYAKAAELDKRAEDPRVNLGKLYLESGFIDRALAVLDEAYKINPKSLEANNNLGNAYGAKGLFDKSVFHYELALNLSPRDATTRFNLARAYVQAGDAAKARDSYLELIKLEPTLWDAQFELAKLYVSMGESAAAKRTINELLTKKPDYTKRPEAEVILAGL